MESIRIVQRQVLQQLFLRTHPVRARSSQQLRSIGQSSHFGTKTAATRFAPSRSFLHTSPRQRTLWSNTSTRFSFVRSNGRRGAARGAATSATAAAAEKENLSLSQRLRKLSREYGWSALGVYFLLSALDFPFCFIAVRLLGTDRIGHWEHVVVSKIKDWISVIWPQGADAVDAVEGQGKRLLEEGVQKVDTATTSSGRPRILEESSAEETYEVMEHGYKEAEEANRGSNASLWTQLALAYAIHKSFIFIRVPLTAAVTPKVVKTLRGWGWNIGKRPVKKPAGATEPGSTAAGVNTKGTGVKSD